MTTGLPTGSSGQRPGAKSSEKAVTPEVVTATQLAGFHSASMQDSAQCDARASARTQCIVG
ncbi:MAG: hypothetical protein R3F31_20685 [Verrucomicrobiales bacterium]